MSEKSKEKYKPPQGKWSKESFMSQQYNNDKKLSLISSNAAHSPNKKLSSTSSWRNNQENNKDVGGINKSSRSLINSSNISSYTSNNTNSNQMNDKKLLIGLINDMKQSLEDTKKKVIMDQLQKNRNDNEDFDTKQISLEIDNENDFKLSKSDYLLYSVELNMLSFFLSKLSIIQFPHKQPSWTKVRINYIL
jgi:hypothetical protein